MKPSRPLLYYTLVRRGAAATGHDAADLLDLLLDVLDLTLNELHLRERAAVDGGRIDWGLEAPVAKAEEIVVAVAASGGLLGLVQDDGTGLEEKDHGQEERGADGDEDEAAAELGHSVCWRAGVRLCSVRCSGGW